MDLGIPTSAAQTWDFRPSKNAQDTTVEEDVKAHELSEAQWLTGCGGTWFGIDLTPHAYWFLDTSQIHTLRFREESPNPPRGGTSTGWGVRQMDVQTRNSRCSISSNDAQHHFFVYFFCTLWTSKKPKSLWQAILCQV